MKPIKDKVMWCIGYDRMHTRFIKPIPSVHGFLYSDNHVITGIKDNSEYGGCLNDASESMITGATYTLGEWALGWRKKYTLMVFESYEGLLQCGQRLGRFGYKVFQNKATNDHEEVVMFVDNSNMYWMIKGYRFDKVVIDTNVNMKYHNLCEIKSRLNKYGELVYL